MVMIRDCSSVIIVNTVDSIDVVLDIAIIVILTCQCAVIVEGMLTVMTR